MNDFEIFRNTWYSKGDSHRCELMDESVNGTSPVPYAVNTGKFRSIKRTLRTEGFFEYERLHFFIHHKKYYVGVNRSVFCRDIACEDYKRMLNIVQDAEKKEELTLFDMVQI